MDNTVIEIENIGKLYRLGEIGTGTLSHDLNRWFARVRGKEDPFAKVGEVNDRTVKGESDYVWALKEISFEVQQGEAVGIIGRNGAGKSTLLKILSKVTTPSTGSIKITGRIASLLEVGTGFHPELTGRENIFLNGAILGMTKKEIKRKFDEIVAFAGVERYIDTPVKRYSSGMYVRLAFAVAAHLESEILIIDEVLAVGDAEFQKKCLGKMGDVTKNEGRTILFVSHNLQAVNTLCTHAIWLEHGKIKESGTTQIIINNYLSSSQQKLWFQSWEMMEDAPGNQFLRMKSVELLPHLTSSPAIIDTRTPITVKFSFYNFLNEANLLTRLSLFSLSGECIFEVAHDPDIYKEGILTGECLIPGNFLNDGSYYFSIVFVKDTTQELFYFQECLHFDVEDYRENTQWYGKWWGHVRPLFPFSLRANTLE